MLDTLLNEQGAVMSLRVLAEGSAALVFVQVFAAGSSAGFPEAPFYLAAGVSLIGLVVRGCRGVYVQVGVNRQRHFWGLALFKG